EPGLAYSRPAGSGAAVRNTWEGGHASLTPAAAGHAIRATHARPGRTTPLTCRRGTSGLHIRESRHAPAVRCSGWILLKVPVSPGPRSLRHAIPQSDGRIVRGRGPARKDAVRLRPRPSRHPPAVPQPAGQARPLPPGHPAVPPGPAGRVRVLPPLVRARRPLPRTRHPLRPRTRLGHEGRPHLEDQVRPPGRRGHRPAPAGRQLPTRLRLPLRTTRTA